MRLVAKSIRILWAKFQCNTLISVEDIEDCKLFLSLILISIIFVNV